MPNISTLPLFFNGGFYFQVLHSWIEIFGQEEYFPTIFLTVQNLEEGHLPVLFFSLPRCYWLLLSA